ncbi:MAG: peptidoglycan DD-metalloendopeptidase family protein [Spirochaetota bacterium]
METKVFFDRIKPAFPTVIDRKRDLIENQKISHKRRNRPSLIYATKKKPHYKIYSTPFLRILKEKKRTILVFFVLIICFFSIINLSLRLKSCLWEKRRVIGEEQELLYELFIVEGIMLNNRGEDIPGGRELTDEHVGFVLPTLNIRTYTLKKGDSLFSVARTFNVSIDTVISANDIKNAYYLQVGTKLQIPDISGIFYTVKKNDSLYGIGSKYNISVNRIADFNDLDSHVIHTGQRLFIPGASLPDWERAQALGNLFITPVKGILTSRMGFRTDPFTGRWAYHSGIDIANAPGSPVHAVRYGSVVYAGYKGNFGRTVIIQHPEGYESLYAHLERIQVKKGQIVKQASIIGTLGNSGRSTGPHLHFEIHQKNKILDPLKVIRIGH